MVGRWRASRAEYPLLWDVQGAKADMLHAEILFSFYRKINYFDWGKGNIENVITFERFERRPNFSHDMYASHNHLRQNNRIKDGCLLENDSVILLRTSVNSRVWIVSSTHQRLENSLVSKPNPRKSSEITDDATNFQGLVEWRKINVLHNGKFIRAPFSAKQVLNLRN